MRRLLALALVGMLAITALAGAATVYPKRIELPDGFQPEGIAISGDQFYVGSIPTGAVYGATSAPARERSSFPRRAGGRRSA